jgi:hypothetical protein
MGPGPPPGGANEIVDAKGAVKLPSGRRVPGEVRNGRTPNGIDRHAGACRRQKGTKHVKPILDMFRHLRG